MLISLNWLKQYVEIKESVEELKNTLTMIGQEVEAVNELGKNLENVVIGKIIQYEKHPKSDKMSVLLVDVGDEAPLQIVCGAPNHQFGDKVVVAKIGAVLPGDFKIKKAKKRDVESQGMVCSETELNVGNDSSGVIILPENAPIGEEYRKYAKIDDVIFELEITPNRPDCLSYLGIAREIAAYYKRKVKYPVVILNETINQTSTIMSVKIEDDERCKRYFGMAIRNITIGESPEWLKTRIKSMGLNPINNIVDVTNFVMFEYNQPLHAFDSDRIEKNQIIIRAAEKGEKILTLDGVERELKNGELVIADGIKPLALAGIIGGESSKIDDATKNIFLEIAYFEPENIRHTAKFHGVSTDSSYRNERGIDIEAIEAVAQRAASLIVEVAGGEILSEPIDKRVKNSEKTSQTEISVDLKILNKFIGKTLEYDIVAKIITSLGIVIKNIDQNKITVISPTYRSDLVCEADIYEEVVRMYGFENIEPHMPMENIESGTTDPVIALGDLSKKILREIGLNEVINYSFISNKALKILNIKEKTIELKNPLSEDMSLMRPNLIYSLLCNVRDNLNRNFTDLRFFEVSKVYTTGMELANEPLNAIIALAGRPERNLWEPKGESYDFYKLKGYVSAFLESLGIKKYTLEISNDTNFHPGRSADIKIGKDLIGTFGQIHPEITEKMEIKKEEVYIANINLEKSSKFISNKIKYTSLIKYPEVTRDLAIVLDKGVLIGDMLKDIKKASNYIEKIEIFDIYEGSKIAPDKMSVAITMVLRSKDKTLEENEINSTMENVLKVIAKNYNGEIRQ